MDKEACRREAAETALIIPQRPAFIPSKHPLEVEKCMVGQVFGASLAIPVCAVAGGYERHLSDTGHRDEECTATVTLEGKIPAPLVEIRGFFYIFVGDEQVGRSLAVWFRNAPAGESTIAVFETPNLPCA